MVSIGALKDTLAFKKLMTFQKIQIQPEVYYDFSVLKLKNFAMIFIFNIQIYLKKYLRCKVKRIPMELLG